MIEIIVHPADAPETARKLLAAAGDNVRAVRTFTGGFLVPAEIAEAAGLGESPAEVEEESKSTGKRSNRANAAETG